MLSWMHGTNPRVWIETFLLRNNVGCDSEVMALWL
jgi:hypothetical protein